MNTYDQRALWLKAAQRAHNVLVHNLNSQYVHVHTPGHVQYIHSRYKQDSGNNHGSKTSIKEYTTCSLISLEAVQTATYISQGYAHEVSEACQHYYTHIQCTCTALTINRLRDSTRQYVSWWKLLIQITVEATQDAMRAAS